MTNTPWYDYSVTHGYITTSQGPGTDTPHYAEDIATPLDTSITSLVSGVVTKADYQAWGGEVYIQPPGGGPQFYVEHLDMVDVTPGQSVSVGQLLGLSGGQTSGGNHPTSPQYSTGPHTHVGWFTNLVNTSMGLEPQGPNIAPLLQSFVNGTATMINGTVIGASPGASTSAPGASPGASTLGILPSFPTFNQFFGLGSVNWQDVTIRSALVLVGIIIALIVVVKFLQTPEIEEVPENEDS